MNNNKISQMSDSLQQFHARVREFNRLHDMNNMEEYFKLVVTIDEMELRVYPKHNDAIYCIAELCGWANEYKLTSTIGMRYIKDEKKPAFIVW